MCRHSQNFAIVLFPKVRHASHFSIHKVTFILISNAVHLESKFQQTWTWTSCCLCYRPAVFLLHFPSIAFSFAQGKFGCFSKILFILVFIFKKFCLLVFIFKKFCLLVFIFKKKFCLPWFVFLKNSVYLGFYF